MNEKYPAIKLYAKTTISFKAKDSNDISEQYHAICKEDIPLAQIQCVSMEQAKTKRKNNPIDVVISFYDLSTIKEMIADAIQSKGDF